MPIRFEQPEWLLVLLLVVPIVLIARRSAGAVSAAKAWISLVLRVIVVAALAMSLARPSWVQRGEGLTVTMIIDRSDSVPAPLKRSSLEFLRKAVEVKENPEDRVAVLTIARDAEITAMPDSYSAVTVGSDQVDRTATNLAAGIELALAVIPDDTANRLLVVSDGNETVGSVMRAAELARANGVPVDAILLEYEYPQEVLFEQIIAPPRARKGQSVRVRLVLRSQSENTGTVRLAMNETYLDLNGDEPGDGLRVELKPGANVFEQVISLDETGPHQFDGVFIPDDPAADVIARNNEAVAVTFVGGEGKVLVVDDGVRLSRYLVQALEEANVDVDVVPPGSVSGLVFLSGYDSVILVNIPRWAFDDDQDRMLHAYVHDLGGGLVMIGGDQGFGAGGWIDSEVARALPLQLNPPDTRQMPAGALALIMHSCEMAQGNYWGERVAIAAIEALSRLDWVGLIEFNWGSPDGIAGCSWAFPMQRLGDKSGAITAAKTMQIGDMPDFGPSMDLAFQGLMATTAAQRHVIIISDGDPSPPSAPLLQQFIDNRITITTVMVGGHGTGQDRARMRAVATKSGGRFHEPKNPKNLPQIFIKEARIISRSLIQDGDVYTPNNVSGLPGPTQGYDRLPSIDGYVLTAPREGMAQTPLVISTTEGQDPLLAHWNYGLGRSLAFTSDLSELWGSRWAGWAEFRAFWEQTIRWSMRPSAPTNMYVTTRVEADRAVIEVEALDADASSLNFLRTSAVVLRPDAGREVLALQQIGPGRYRGEFEVQEAGAYLVNVGYETADEEGTATGTMQAAVNVPYAPEFRAVKHNRARLQELVDATGGRMIEIGDPALAPIFDRVGLDVPRSMKRMWDVVAMIAAGLLVLDVAARRLAVDPRAMRAAAARAVGRRGEVSEDTVVAWKRSRARVSDERGRTRVDRDEAAVRFEAEEGETGIDIGAETAADPLTAQATVKRQEKTDAADAGLVDDPEAHTSRLLAAKRRARGDDAGGAGDG